MKKIVLIFFFIPLFFLGCKKYSEDENLMHLKTVKARLCHLYFQQYAYNFIINSEVSTSPSDNIRFYRNGKFTSGNSPYFDYAVSWELINKKKQFRLTFGGGVKKIYEIIRLEKNELWFKSDSILFKYENTQ